MKKYIFPLLIAIFTAIQTFAYDFSAVSPSEHILYYDIISQEDKTVNVTYEKNTNEPYENPPVGDDLVSNIIGVVISLFVIIIVSVYLMKQYKLENYG